MSEIKSENCVCNKTETEKKENKMECNCTIECNCTNNAVSNQTEQAVISAEDLHEVYKNACLGKISIEILEKYAQDKGYRNLLIRQYKEYMDIIKEIEIYANKVNIQLQRPSIFARSMMYMTTALNTMTDKSDSKLSEIMLQGINMGRISLTKVLNKLSEENKTCHCAENLLKLLNKNLEEMKMYL